MIDGTMETLDKLIEEGDPTEIFNNLTEIGAGAFGAVYSGFDVRTKQKVSVFFFFFFFFFSRFLLLRPLSVLLAVL